jgi:hypothetical protein
MSSNMTFGSFISPTRSRVYGGSGRERDTGEAKGKIDKKRVKNRRQ